MITIMKSDSMEDRQRHKLVVGDTLLGRLGNQEMHVLFYPASSLVLYVLGLAG